MHIGALAFEVEIQFDNSYDDQLKTSAAAISSGDNETVLVSVPYLGVRQNFDLKRHIFKLNVVRWREPSDRTCGRIYPMMDRRNHSGTFSSLTVWRGSNSDDRARAHDGRRFGRGPAQDNPGYLSGRTQGLSGSPTSAATPAA